MKSNDVKITVVTSINIANLINGSLDVSALNLLLKNDIKVYNFQNLHAKIYLFDKMNAIITSANLTNSAMFKNYEYGVKINNDDSLSIIYNDFKQMIDESNQITLDDIDNINIKIEYHKKEKTIVSKDNDDSIIIINNINEAFGDNWVDNIFILLNKIPNSEFSLSDVYLLEDVLQEKYPNNKHIRDKIRQCLQKLRDLGYIKFYGNGKYKKLWKIHN